MAPSESSTDQHRLPRHVRPLNYDLALDVDLDGARFTGEVGIDLEVVEPTARIECNSLNLVIHHVELNGAPVLQHHLDPDAQRLVIELDQPLATGRAQLRVTFTGVLNDQLVGFYRSTYTGDEGTHTLAISQFEAPHARQCFPCWDEPDRKATFAVTLIVDDDLLAVSNASEVDRLPLDNGRVAVQFARTMPMSTYLVAFVVGRLEATEPIDVDGVPLRVIHRPGQGHLTHEALAVAAHSLRWFTNYYGIAYPGDKLDLIAVPDFAFGAMENLGCVTFREVLLLLDPEQVTQAELERAATVIAHEIAHMWFGDLVTMDWWDGIWLNEAFATFMELACTDDYRPELGVWRTFGLGRAQAFDTDALSTTRAIHYEVHTPEDAEGMFDILTYEKGAAVLRMLEQHLGSDVFRDGIRRYLAQHSYGNTHMGDLWASLDAASGVDVAAVMDSWILQGGHPIVEVAASDTGVRLTQTRMAFAGGGPSEPRQWSVPLRIRSVVNGHTDETRVLLDQTSLDVDLGGRPDLVCANASSFGFYRTGYDADLRAALTGELTFLDPVERFGLLDDGWALLNADRLTLPAIIELITAVRTDTDTSVLRRMASIVADLHGAAGPNDGRVERFCATAIAEVLDEVTQPERRSILLRLAGGIGANPAVIDEARRTLLDADDQRTGSVVRPELLVAAIDVASTHGDHSVYEQFLDRFRTANGAQDKQRYLNALTRFSDRESFERTLHLCLDEVRTQDAPYTLGAALGHHRHGPLAWTFIAEHWATIMERFPSNSISRMLSGLRSVWDRPTAEHATTFLADHPVPQGTLLIAQHLEVLQVHQSLSDRLADQWATALPDS